MLPQVRVVCDTLDAKRHLDNLVDELGESLRFLGEMTGIEDILMGLGGIAWG